MKCHIKFIGVIDHQNHIHHVTFHEGLNVITGKSSTGKSAIMEIFDFCMGSGNDTIPIGEITTRTKVFFTVLQFSTYRLVLARERKSTSAFLKTIYGEAQEHILGLMVGDKFFFDSTHYFPIRDFKKELGRHFAVTLADIDEDATPREYGVKKSSTPSVRSFASFMLQHQNLVANKHALFYRFDEKEKREQVIDHFKIFMGIVDQEYFWISQEHNELQSQLKKIDLLIPKKKQQKDSFISEISDLLVEYKATSGTDLVALSAEKIGNTPQKALQEIRMVAVRIDSQVDSFGVQKRALEEARSLATVERRTLQNKLHAVQSSIGFTEKFKQTADSVVTPDFAEVGETVCPLCDSHSDQTVQEVNRLSAAIDWLNDELRMSAYARESFREEEKKILKEISAVKEKLSGIQEKINTLDLQLGDLENKKTLDELALKVKVKLELKMEEYIKNPPSEYEGTRKIITDRLKVLKPLLEAYKVGEKLDELSGYINNEMERIGEKFGFEKAYCPIKLRFDLASFDLWHESPEIGNVYLRSMGSGANWLYSHLTLFLALHSAFAANHEMCKIPPILFLDQPTQVYFPATIDHSRAFDANALAAIVDRKTSVDDDMASVTNMFNQFHQFCLQTAKDTGITPQIIVTDHADDLEMEGDLPFETFVVARWRERGFIADVPEAPEAPAAPESTDVI
ncbi:DUF3732 domain-containing protein [Pseudomonas chlororaphis]|uniref:DUF3732 domain-containing protein n=1 Tax=Pseudomonas chlororaphis TaxID=587753 RepID=UPI00068F87FF|nr:DUF3732 domain-containing protein [Pseudomonas chlororaphis]